MPLRPTLRPARALLASLALISITAACEGPEGLTGPAGPPGAAGPTGGTGPSGTPGTPGTPGAVGRSIFGVTDANQLIAFGSGRPDIVSRRLTITGVGAGEQVVGIDFRPADGKLYALGSTSRIYTIDTTTAIATAVGPSFTPALSGTAFGFDFNPVPDRIRIHTDADQDLRLVPTTGAVAATDGTLAYAAGDAGAGSDPAVAGTAYTNSVAGATTTVLYAIDVTRDVLVRLGNPNDGLLTTVGSLGVNTGPAVGFDIAGADAFAAMAAVGSPGASLFRIDLSTGAATVVGFIGSGFALRGIAVAP